jgi:hypothetical protein
MNESKVRLALGPFGGSSSKTPVAKFGCDLAGPVLKPELPNGPLPRRFLLWHHFFCLYTVGSTATSNVLTAASDLYAFSCSVIVLRQQHYSKCDHLENAGKERTQLPPQATH